MRKIAALILSLIVIALLVISLLFYIQYSESSGQSNTRTSSLSTFKVESLRIVSKNNSTVIGGFVYVASTGAQQIEGFQNATNFGNCNGSASASSECIGMIFVFSGNQSQCFWMHNTIMPLQQVWISGNGTVTYIYHAHPETDFTVCYPAAFVLETNPNATISVGDVVLQASAAQS
jgi:uncharacterized membrane protein (UPF0127 family)